MHAASQPFVLGWDNRKCDNPNTRSAQHEASKHASPADPTNSAMGTVVSQPIPILTHSDAESTLEKVKSHFFHRAFQHPKPLAR
jgi:hypothetical protein